MRSSIEASLLAIALIIVPFIAASDDASDPLEVFEQFYEPVETLMGVDIKASKAKLKLLAGEVTVDTISVSHPAQPDLIVAKGASFPFGAIAGLSNPSQARAVVKKLTLDVDFAHDRFWYTNPGGEPIEGAPDLSIATLGVKKGTIRLADGPAPTLLIDGFSGAIDKMKLPGKIWSAGQVPKKTWASATLAGGAISMPPLPLSASIIEASAYFEGNVFHLENLEAQLSEGIVVLSGTVEMKKGRPSSWDLVATLEDVHIERPALEGVLDGTLSIEGPTGKVKIKGDLTLTQVEVLEKATWSVSDCTASPKIAVSLLVDGKKTKKARLKGTLCSGKLVP